VILAILIGTQPKMALGAGAMLSAILIGGLATTRSRVNKSD